MIGLLANAVTIIVGTLIGCILKGALKEKYQEVLFTAMGLAALGIGLENVTNNLPKSHYPVLFIVSLSVGVVLGTWWQIDDRFNNLINHFGGESQLATGLATSILLYCIGPLSIVGPVMSAVKGDDTMLLANATLDLVSSIAFGASFGWIIMLSAPVILCWQGSIFLIAKYLSAGFFSPSLITEISIIGGFLITTTGISLMKLRKIKTLDFLPSLLVPVIFFIGKSII